MTKTKQERVLNYMMKDNSITPKTAYRLFSTMRLADIIFKLRNKGWDITTYPVKRDGESYAKYRLYVPHLREKFKSGFSG